MGQAERQHIHPAVSELSISLLLQGKIMIWQIGRRRRKHSGQIKSYQWVPPRLIELTKWYPRAEPFPECSCSWGWDQPGKSIPCNNKSPENRAWILLSSLSILFRIHNYVPRGWSTWCEPREVRDYLKMLGMLFLSQRIVYLGLFKLKPLPPPHNAYRRKDYKLCSQLTSQEFCAAL